MFSLYLRQCCHEQLGSKLPYEFKTIHVPSSEVIHIIYTHQTLHCNYIQ